MGEDAAAADGKPPAGRPAGAVPTLWQSASRPLASAPGALPRDRFTPRPEHVEPHCPELRAGPSLGSEALELAAVSMPSRRAPRERHPRTEARKRPPAAGTICGNNGCHGPGVTGQEVGGPGDHACRRHGAACCEASTFTAGEAGTGGRAAEEGGAMARCCVRASSLAVRSSLAAGIAARRMRSRYWRSRHRRDAHSGHDSMCFALRPRLPRGRNPREQLPPRPRSTFLS